MTKTVKKIDLKRPPRKMSWYLFPLVQIISRVGLRFHNYKLKKTGMEGIKPPYVMLSNHASMVDFMAMMTATYPHGVNNVASVEAFHDYSEWLFRRLGNAGKRKFIKDLNLIRNIRHCLNEYKNVFNLYPEARYSLDGCTSFLPDSLGKMLKLFGVPVVMLKLGGNFVTCPQWNKHQKNSRVEGEMFCMLTAEEVKSLSVDQINQKIKESFVYDDFAWQKQNGVIIDHPKRADGLHSILYQCPECNTEHEMYSEGTELWCAHCGKRWVMTELGELQATDGNTRFTHIPDWFNWERENVRAQVNNGSYLMEAEVRIDTMPNARGFINQGNGRFVQDCNGLTLSGTAYGKPFVLKKDALEQESVHIEYDYKKQGDCIDVSEAEESYWFYPLDKRDVITKISLATEEIYLMHRKKLHSQKASDNA